MGYLLRDVLEAFLEKWQYTAKTQEEKDEYETHKEYLLDRFLELKVIDGF